MSVTIEVRENDRIYHPGNLVTGILRIRPIGEGEKVDVSQVRVELVGESLSRIDEHGSSDRALKARVPLFRHEKVLLTGPYTIASIQEWPFEFAFPEDCRHASDRPFGLNERQQRHFNRNKAQPLPPSINVTSAHAMEDTKTCTIEYYVRGTLDLQGSLHRQREATRQLKLWSYGDDADLGPPEHSMHSQNIKIVSPHLDPLVGDRELSAKEKLKAKFSSHIPSVSFKLMVEMPNSGTIFAPVPIYMRIQQIADNEKGELPSVALREFSVKAIRQIILATNSGGGTFEKILPIEHLTQEISLVSWAGNAPIVGRLDLRTLYEHKKFDWRRITPTFSTFNVQQTWTLWLTATVEVAKKLDTVHVKQQAYKLLSPFSKTSSRAEGTTTIVESSAPPSYEQSTKE